MSATNIPKRRIHELDLLRGFFIVVIILDHLQFWPSPLQYLTGQGRLWVSAAEGFFIISGLLIGYLRLYKDAHVDISVLAQKLWKRAVRLWLWCVIITFTVTALTVLLPGDGYLMPRVAQAEQVSSLPVYLWNVVTMNYANDWIYFLRLYAIMLAITPFVVWCVRQGKWWFVALGSLGLYALSLVLQLSESALQWQVLFFGAALVGWKFEHLLAWLHARPKIFTTLKYSLVAVTFATMALSYFMVHGWSYVESPATSLSRNTYISIRTHVDPLFSNSPLVPLRIGLAFVWFSGLLALFHLVRQPLERALGWLLYVFGKASLTAYCLQALLLGFVTSFVSGGNSFWLNGLVGVAVLLVFWLLMRLPLTKQILPT